jgi:hypothetical protein
MGLPAEYFHRSFPDARSTATRSPGDDPTYTVPSTIAADESIDSPISSFQTSLRAAGGALAVTPVKRGLPRNWGQLSLAVGAGTCANDGPLKESNHEDTKITKNFHMACFVSFVCFVVPSRTTTIYFAARA